MKKIIKLFLIIMTTVSLTGCAQKVKIVPNKISSLSLEEYK